MADAVDPRGGEIEVTPEEERFLKRFFRRQVLPWAAALMVFSVASAWWWRGDDGASLEARTAAGLAQLRSENQRLRAELEGLAGRLERDAARPVDEANELERRVEDAKRSVRAIEARVTAALDRRLDALEARMGAASPPADPSGAAPPPEAAAWDVSAILDRLYALEMRQERDAASQESAHQSLAARVDRLEAGSGAIPAAPYSP